MKVIVDGYGGDNAPKEIVKGACLALAKHPSLNIVITGKTAELQGLLNENKADLSRIEILDANEIISCEEAPVEAIRGKKDSSLVVAFDYLKANPDCFGLVSAGSTGAVLTGAFVKLGRIRGISRPALAPALPTLTGGKVLLIDCGANMDSTPENLCHFALMGSEYMKLLCGIEKPRVALLNVGVEDSKGNELTKAAFPELQKLPINFVGNMEARDALSGNYDVIVSDGFAGNVLLKGTEGAISTLLKLIKNGIKASFSAKIGYLFMKKVFKGIKKTLDHDSVGGSPFLGAKGLVIKAHGSSKAASIAASITQVVEMGQAKLVEGIENALANIKI